MKIFVVVAVACVLGIAHGLEPIIFHGLDHVISFHSLKPPILHQYQASGLRYWDFAGSVVVTDPDVQLTPKPRSVVPPSRHAKTPTETQERFGAVWNTMRTDMNAFVINATIFVEAMASSEKGTDVDYMLFSATEEPIKTLDDLKNGIGIIVLAKGDENQFLPFLGHEEQVSVAENHPSGSGTTGSIMIAARSDPHMAWTVLDACLMDYHDVFLHMRIEFRDDIHTMQVFVGANDGEVETIQFYPCAMADSVMLPTTYVFGTSAYSPASKPAQHDLESFIVMPMPNMEYDRDVTQVDAELAAEPLSIEELLTEMEQKLFWIMVGSDREATKDELADATRRKREREVAKK